MRLLSTIALVVIALVPRMSAQEKPGPTLNDTEAWITNTLEHGDGGRGFGTFYERYKQAEDNSEYTVRVSFRACEMTITTHSIGGVISTYTHTVDTVNLKDLDPRMIKVMPCNSGSKDGGGMDCYVAEDECDEAQVRVETRDAKLAVRSESSVEFKNKRLNSDGKPTVDYKEHAYVAVSDVGYAKKLARALTRTIELCGGKPSTF